MSHINKEFFEAHPAQPLIEEIAQYLGVDLSAWEFSDGIEVAEGDLEYITVIYSPTNEQMLEEGWTIYGVVILNESGEWEIQQFGMSKD